jgi:hypothetical protein
VGTNGPLIAIKMNMPRQIPRPKKKKRKTEREYERPLISPSLLIRETRPKNTVLKTNQFVPDLLGLEKALLLGAFNAECVVIAR